MNVRVVAAAVVLAAGLSGCSGKSEPIRTPETVGIPGTALPIPGEGATSGPVPTEPAPGGISSTASASSTGVDPYPVINPKDEASAVAFVRSYLQALNQGFRNPATSTVTRFTAPECKTCAGFADSIAEMKKQGKRQSSDFVKITRMRADFAPGRSVVVVLLDELPAQILDRTGKVTFRKTGQRGIKASYFLKRVQGSWLIEETKIYEGEV